MHDTPPDDVDTPPGNEALDHHVKELMGPSPTETEPTPPETAKNDDEPVPPAPQSVIEPDSPPEDVATEGAVDDIAAKEGDEVLAAEDAEVAKAFEQPKKSKLVAVKQFFKKWWDNPKARWATIAGLVAVLILIIALPVTRYFLLNSVGVRGKASVIVLDDSTQLPLKNVQVSVGGQSSKTDSNGVANLAHVKLGHSELVISKPAFATEKQGVTLGWGSNPLGSRPITAVGAQYTFVVKDWLSGKPVPKAEAASGDANAQSDKNGKIVLTVDVKGDVTSLPVSISASNYRTEKLALDLSLKAPQAVNMVPGRRQVFVSNRSGKDDLYKIDVDGKNEKLILAGTGSEQDNIALVPHPTDEVAAMVSTRDNVHNGDGFLLSTLTLVDLSDDTTSTLAQSERIQLVGWVGSRLIYVQIAAGASATNPKRYRLISYDYKAKVKDELASANSFNDVILVGGNIYYSQASTFATDPNTGLYKTSADGKIKKPLLSQEVWNIFRVSYSTFDLSVQQNWYQYNLSDLLPTKLSTVPANPKSRVYLDSPDGKHSLWVDQRDGKGVLLSYDTTAKTDKVLLSQSGLSYPVRWLSNNTLIYRIHTPSETTDYVLNTDGGQPHKIRDVFNTAGLELWYYY